MSTKTDIWMPFYVADYLADTTRLTTEQHGAYMLLILDYWRNGPPPADDATLAQITRMSPDAWSNACGKVLAFFVQRDGMLVHSRIEREKVAAAGNKDKKTAKAKAAAEARWGKDASGNAPSNAQALPKQCPSPSPTPSPKGEENLVGAGAPGGVERRAEYLEKIEDVLPAGPASLPGPPLPPAPPPPPAAPVPPKAAKHHGTEEDFTAARWIFDQVRKLNATAKEPTWAAWANDVRLMREIDGRTHKEICELFGWVTRDSFWCGNVLSPGKLREKWDQLTVRRGQPATGAQRAPGQVNSKFHGLNSLDHSGAEALHAASMKRMGIEQKPIDPTDPIDF